MVKKSEQNLRLPYGKSNKKKYLGRTLAENGNMLLMVLPGLFLLILFNYVPFPGTIIAFKDFSPIKGVWGSEWCGLENFKFFFESPNAFRVFLNTILYGVLFLIVDLLAALTLAVMFFFLRSPSALKVYNTAVILPRFMSSVIIAFIAYSILSPTSGLLNTVIVALGGDPVLWYQEPGRWPFILTIVHIWQTVGINSILYYSSLISLDPGQLEAAELDGASRMQQIIYVIIPHLVPIMVVTTILNIGHILGGDVGLFNQTTKNVGVLYPTTDIINTYVYRAMLDGSLAQSAAVNLFQSVVGFFLVIGTNLIVKKISPENSIF